MAAAPVEGKESILFAEGYALDLRPRRLRRGSRTLKLERIPLEILRLLLEHPGETVSRDLIVSRVWGQGVFLDTDNSIRGAIRKLRRVLTDDADTPRFIETVTGQGYRFIAPVVNPADSIAETEVRTKASAKRVLAILPFDNLTRDPDQEFFSDGLTEEMITQAAKLNREQLAVVARSSVARYKATTLSAKEIGAELKADYLVEGSVRRLMDRVRITVRLIEAQSQTDLWTETYDRELKDVLDVQDSVVRSIASQIHIALDEGRAPLPETPYVLPEAYVAYLKGRYYWNKRTGAGIQKAERYFQDAIQIDPTSGPAYSGLADCNSGLAWHGFRSPADSLPKAYSAARKAIDINPRSAEAHASMGLVLSHGWHWTAAEAEFRRALELDPQYANAHHWYADYLSIRGRHQEALAEARRALELDPLNLMISTWVGLRFYQARNYSAAIRQNRDSVELDPNFAAAHLLLGTAYAQAGMRDESVTELKMAAALSGDSPLYTAQVGAALAAAGRTHDALQVVDALQTISTSRYVSPYGVAQIYAALGRDGEVLKWLHVGCADRAVWMGYLAVDPIFDRYRSDRRFQELVTKVGLDTALGA
jgi:TolB-like protein/Tfp pilus assembly protein PilF